MAKTYEFELNMDKQKREPNIAYARVGDTESVIIRATLYDGESAYTPTGTNAFFECVCPNGASVRQSATKSGSVVSVTLASQVFQAAGVINVAYFRFESGSTSDPTYVESTEPFVIIVLSGIDDNITAEDYIAEWRSLQDKFSEIVDFAEQAYPTIQQAVSDVTAAKNDALDTINSAKEEIESASADIMTPINNAIDDMNERADAAISQFNSNGTSAVESFNKSGQSAISSFNTSGTSAVSQFKTNSQAEITAFDANASNKLTGFDDDADAKLAQYDTDVSNKLGQVDTSIADATSKVNQNVAALEKATQDAIDAMESALSDDQYGELIQRLGRVWKLDMQDMVMIPDVASLNDYVAVGSYYAPESSMLENRPTDMTAPFVMYVLKVTSTKTMQFLIPVEHEAGDVFIKLYIREQNSSTFTDWYPIGGAGGTDIELPLSIENGGTGATSSASARNTLGAASATMSQGSSVTDSTYAVTALGTSSSQRIQFSSIWNWIVTKIRSVFGFSSSNVLPVSNGGTGATTAEQARANIGAGTSSFSGSYNDLSDKPAIPEPIEDPLPVANGGTGSSTAANARTSLGAAIGNQFSTFSSLNSNTPIVSTSTTSSQTRFNLSALLSWLKEQDIGGGNVPDFVLSRKSATDGHLLYNGTETVQNINVSDSPEETGIAHLQVDTVSDTKNACADARYTGVDGYALAKLRANNPDDVSATESCADVLIQSPSGAQANFAIMKKNTSSSVGDKIQFFMSQTKSTGAIGKQAQFIIDYDGSSYLGNSAIPWDYAYIKNLRLTTALDISQGGTGASTQKAAEYNVINPTKWSGMPSLNQIDVVCLQSSPSTTNGRLRSVNLSNLYAPIMTQIMTEVFTGSGGTLPVALGGTNANSSSGALHNLRIFWGSKVINNGETYAVLFSNSEYSSIVGRGFSNTTDVVVVMNGDADATQTEMTCCTWKASTQNIGVFCGSAGARRVNYLILAP